MPGDQAAVRADGEFRAVVRPVDFHLLVRAVEAGDAADALFRQADNRGKVEKDHGRGGLKVYSFGHGVRAKGEEPTGRGTQGKEADMGRKLLEILLA